MPTLKLNTRTMAIFVNVRSPQKLLDDMKSLITIGEIQEWTIDDDGDFTLSDERLKNEAWFHPYLLSDDVLIFGIIGRKNVKMSMSLYSAYHGEFIKTLLNNYNRQLDRVSVVPPFSNDFDTKKIEK